MDYFVSRMPRPSEGNSLAVDIGIAIFMAVVGALFLWSFALNGQAQLLGGIFAMVLAGATAAYSATVMPSRSFPLRATTLVALGLTASILAAPHADPQALIDLSLALLLWVVVRSSFARRIQARILQERANQLARERVELARTAVADERARIARELHDVVAHSMGVMVVQAQGADRVMETDPASAREALKAIVFTGREALDEMHRMVGLLRRPEEGSDLSPQPGLSQLDRLVNQAREAGLRLAVEVAGSVRPLPAGLDLAAYRIIQEALTNCRKYADGAQASLVVRYEDHRLDIDVMNQAPLHIATRGSTAVSGHGLVGMKERVALYGGQFSAGLRPDGGYAVHVSLPLDSAPG
jgi:signal transduction histidine kinase